jgi:flagellum-specific peptidoglycan hydrolase FlgJ
MQTLIRRAKVMYVLITIYSTDVASNKSILPIILFSTFGLVALANTIAKDERGDNNEPAPEDNGPSLPLPSGGKLTPSQFIQKFKDFATATQTNYQVPSVFTLAQGGLESGWGNSDVFTNANNAFGIKASTAGLDPWIGPTYNGYRKYASVQDSFDDHAKFLTGNSRYNAAFNTSDPVAFGKAVAAAGYATDPDYSNKIVNVITTVQGLQ